jgi:hypothetical protein|tara:strand:- start:226 stop:402 length:177 start_codon:yes stop_codon:yes gene_type:complete
MNQSTRRNDRKASQLEHIKQKLKKFQLGDGKFNKAYKKKLSLVKSLKNLKKRITRKGL